MLEFWKDGKKNAIYGIYSKGNVGQMVIFGQRVDWGVNASPTQRPLSQYSCPSVFTIVEKNEEVLGYYILSDIIGNRIKVDLRSDSAYLYDAQEWLEWNEMHEKEKLSRKERKIEQLQGHVDLLKDILIKQGIRTVTEKQAENLGIG